MAEVMSLIFMVFMAMPIIAPASAVLLLTGPWQSIFVFMAGLATLISLWAFFRLPETLHPEYRRELTFKSVTGGFGIVFTNRLALFYGLAGMFLFGAMFGFVSSSQQIFVDIFGLGALFPVAFAAMTAGMMAVSSFLNSRIVKRFGMRRLSHFALIVYISGSILLVAFSLAGFMPLWLFFNLLMIVQFVFGWAASNMNSLSMEPLGAVAGTAASVFGFIQTVGALLGTMIGLQFNGTTTPIALGYLVIGSLALGCVLIAENGRLFGVGKVRRRPLPKLLVDLRMPSRSMMNFS